MLNARVYSLITYSFFQTLICRKPIVQTYCYIFIMCKKWVFYDFQMAYILDNINFQNSLVATKLLTLGAVSFSDSLNWQEYVHYTVMGGQHLQSQSCYVLDMGYSQSVHQTSGTCQLDIARMSLTQDLVGRYQEHRVLKSHKNIWLFNVCLSKLKVWCISRVNQITIEWRLYQHVSNMSKEWCNEDGDVNENKLCIILSFMTVRLVILTGEMI